MRQLRDTREYVWFNGGWEGNWNDLPLQPGFTFTSGGYAKYCIRDGLFYLLVRNVRSTSGGAATMLDTSTKFTPPFEVPVNVFSGSGTSPHTAWLTSGGLLRATWQTGIDYRVAQPGIPM